MGRAPWVLFRGDCAALGARAGVRRRAIAGSGRSAVWPVPPFDGFVPIVSGEGADFVAARRDAHRVCARTCRAGGVGASKPQRAHAERHRRLRESTRRVQRAWGRDSCPPYVELPAAWVHTGCHSADLPEVLTHLRRHMRVDCSPFVAVLHSKDCSTLLAAIRSMVSQLMARVVPGCSYDLEVLTGWHADLCAGRVAARARQSGGAAMASHLHGTSAAWTPLVVVVEDAEHFQPDVLNDLIYACAAAPASGVPLPSASSSRRRRGGGAARGAAAVDAHLPEAPPSASPPPSAPQPSSSAPRPACLPQLGARTRPARASHANGPSCPAVPRAPGTCAPPTHHSPSPPPSSPFSLRTPRRGLSEQHGSTTAFVKQRWVRTATQSAPSCSSSRSSRSRHPAAGAPACRAPGR